MTGFNQEKLFHSIIYLTIRKFFSTQIFWLEFFNSTIPSYGSLFFQH